MQNESAFTLMDLLVAVTLAGILGGFATLNLMEVSNPSRSAASEVATYIKQIRARALATTSAYTITPSGANSIVATFGNTCADIQTPDAEMTLNITNASITNLAWSVCYNSRGFPDANVSIPVTDVYSGAATVEVLLGGSIRVQ